MKTKFLLVFFLFFQLLMAQDTIINLELKNNYDLMIKSESYREYENELKKYSSKIFFTEDLYKMGYEESFLELIKQKIQNTSFENYEIAEKEYYSLKDKFNNMKKHNQGFFISLSNSDIWDFADIIAPVNKYNDPCQCEKAFGGAYNALALKYETILKNSEESAISAWISYEKNKYPILKALEMCRLGCDK